MNKDYCVYLHRRDSDGVVFYIGKGRKYRPFNRSGRSKAWNDFIKEDSFSVEILHQDLTFEESEAIEIRYLENTDSSWQLVNMYGDRRPSDLLKIVDHIYYDPSSPTFIRWRFDSCAGKRKKDGIAGSIHKDDYAGVMVERKTYSVHRLIWVLFNKREIPAGYVVNHIDCNPSNNDIKNLEVITYAENNRRKFMHIGKGLASSNKSGVNGIHESKSKPQGTKCYYNARVMWRENEVTKYKCFSYLKYGKEEAWRLAQEFQDSLKMKEK